MAECRIVNAGAEEAYEKLNKIATSYNDAGGTFVADLTAAIADMEGASKDAFQDYIDVKVKELVSVDLGKLISGLAELVEANRKSFAEVDAQLASSMQE